MHVDICYGNVVTCMVFPQYFMEQFCILSSRLLIKVMSHPRNIAKLHLISNYNHTKITCIYHIFITTFISDDV